MKTSALLEKEVVSVYHLDKNRENRYLHSGVMHYTHHCRQRHMSLFLYHVFFAVQWIPVVAENAGQGNLCHINNRHELLSKIPIDTSMEYLVPCAAIL